MLSYDLGQYFSNSVQCIPFSPSLSPQPSIFIVRVVDNRSMSRQFNGGHCWHGTSKDSVRRCAAIDPVNHLFLVWTVELTKDILRNIKQP